MLEQQTGLWHKFYFENFKLYNWYEAFRCQKHPCQACRSGHRAPVLEDRGAGGALYLVLIRQKSQIMMGGWKCFIQNKLCLGECIIINDLRSTNFAHLTNKRSTKEKCLENFVRVCWIKFNHQSKCKYFSFKELSS